MDVNKNSYTIGFAAVMVIIVAALLSSAAIGLKPFQAKNIEQEKKQNILKSVGIEAFIISNIDTKFSVNDDIISAKRNDTVFVKKSDDVKVLNTEGKYTKYKDIILTSREMSEMFYPRFIKKELVIDYKGNLKEGKSAFDVNLAKEVKKDIKEQDLPLYIAEVDGETKYIIPLRGKGLWGPIWGFISLNDDLNTISAAVFAHKSETPGLGAEINTAKFQNPFTGKTIFDGVEFTSVSVVKNIVNENNQVNGISGGTITSVGVSKMIEERLEKYLPYFETLSPEMQVENIVNIVDADESLDSTSNINERIVD